MDNRYCERTMASAGVAGPAGAVRPVERRVNFMGRRFTCSPVVTWKGIIKHVLFWQGSEAFRSGNRRRLWVITDVLHFYKFSRAPWDGNFPLLQTVE